MLRKVALVLSAFSVLLSVSTARAVPDASPREVRVSYYTYGNFHGRTADGRYFGFGYDVFEMLAKKLGWKNRYVGQDRAWGEMPKMVESGEIEILDCVRKRPEREALYEFSAQPMSYSFGYMLVRTNETRFASNDYANWGRLRVGSMAGGYVGGDFRGFAEVHGIEAEPVELMTEEDVLSALETGGIDMAVVESTFYDGSGKFRSVGELSPVPCYFCTKKGNKALMREIDRAMAEIYNENPAWYVEARRKHFPMKDVVVYLPRGHHTDEIHRRYLTAMADLLGAIGNWNPVVRECAEDFSDADFSVPCVVADVHRTPEALAKFDFPFVPVCRRPICLVCDPKDSRFKGGRASFRENRAVFKVGYDRSEDRWLKCFLDYAEARNIAFTLVPFDNQNDLRQGVKAATVDLAVLGVNPRGELRIVDECGCVEFDFATPKEQPAVAAMLDMATRYVRYHEGPRLRKLEKYAYGIEESSRTVRAGVYAEFGAIDIAEDGSIGGFMADYLREIALEKNWDLILVPMTCTEAIDCLTAGEIDIVGTTSPCPDSSPGYYHSRRDAGVVRYALKVRTDSPLRENRPDLWTGNRIGYLAGSHPVEELKVYLDGIGAKYQLVPYASLKDAQTDVKNGRLDGIYTIHARESRDYRTIALFPLVHVYFCVSARRPDVLADVDSAMEYFSSHNMDFNWWLNNHYLKSSRELLTLDASEIEYVRRHRGRKIVIGFPESVVPIAHFDEKTGRAGGFLARLFRVIDDKLDLDFEFTGKGRADVYVTHNEYAEGRQGLIVHRNWFPVPSVRVSRPESDIPVAARGIWAVEAKRTEEIEYLRNRNLKPMILGSRFECYRAVAEGRAEATIDNLGSARLMIDENRDFRGLRDTRIDSKQFARQVAVAFPTEGDPELRRILKKARSSITDVVAEKLLLDAIIANRQGRFNSEDLVFYGVIAAMAIIVIILFILLVTNRRIRIEQMSKRISDAANKAKTSFLFNMSHDIRTPMNAIMGFTEIAKDHLNDRALTADCLVKIESASRLLLTLINSILDMSRIEAGKAKVEEKAYDVMKSFADIESTMYALAFSRGVELTFGFGEMHDRYVFADIERCERVFVNLISNAIKYSKPNGWVHVRCEQIIGETGDRKEKREGWTYAFYRYTVEDNGIGMSEEFQEHLFEHFSRERNATTSGIEGTGLGLALVKSFVELMGGTIKCRSRQGEGTTFTVELPFKLREAGGEVKAEVKAVKGEAETRNAVKSTDRLESSPSFSSSNRRILLVDDNELNREVASFLLKGLKFEVDTAVNGSEAVEKASNFRYALILMDIQMPIMDGFEATKAIRAAGVRVPIIALSANAFAEERELTRSAGMDDHVSKPFRLKELTDAFERVGVKVRASE